MKKKSDRLVYTSSIGAYVVQNFKRGENETVFLWTCFRMGKRMTEMQMKHSIEHVSIIL